MIESENPQWKPKLWIAVVLGLFFQSLAMLYLHRVLWAVVYFVAIVTITLAELYLRMINDVASLAYLSLSYVVMLIGAVHAYFLAKNYQGTENRAWYSKWYSLIGIFLVMNLSFLPGRIFLYESFNLPANSMAPSYPAGSYVIIKKWGYGNYKLFGLQVWKSKLSAPINHGDVIVFEYPENRNISYIKRVIGVPGDAIRYENKKIFINNQLVEYSNLKETDNTMIVTETIEEKSYQILLNGQNPANDLATTVPAEKYFVLGDNRDNSRDSRYWGFVPEAYIIGKVVHFIKPEFELPDTSK